MFPTAGPHTACGRTTRGQARSAEDSGWSQASTSRASACERSQQRFRPNGSHGTLRRGLGHVRLAPTLLFGCKQLHELGPVRSVHYVAPGRLIIGKPSQVWNPRPLPAWRASSLRFVLPRHKLLLVLTLPTCGDCGSISTSSGRRAQAMPSSASGKSG